MSYFMSGIVSFMSYFPGSATRGGWGEEERCQVDTVFGTHHFVSFLVGGVGNLFSQRLHFVA